MPLHGRMLCLLRDKLIKARYLRDFVDLIAANGQPLLLIAGLFQGETVRIG